MIRCVLGLPTHSNPSSQRTGAARGDYTGGRRGRPDSGWSGLDCSRCAPPRPLLARHSELETLVGTDEVVVVVLAEVDLHPVDLAVEDASAAVFGAHRGAVVTPDVRRLVAGERH